MIYKALCGLSIFRGQEEAMRASQIASSRRVFPVMETCLFKSKRIFLQARACLSLRIALGVFLFTLAGCSQVPDAANPIEWYKGVAGWFEDDEAYAEGSGALDLALERERQAAEDEAFPNLSEVPPRPPVYDPGQAAEVTKGLVADRARAQYSDETIRLQSEMDKALPPPRPRPVPKEAPPPAAAPRSPVTVAGELSEPRPMPNDSLTPLGEQTGTLTAKAPPPPVFSQAPQPGVPSRQSVMASPRPTAIAPRPIAPPEMVAASLQIPNSEIVPSLPYFPASANELNQTMQQYLTQSAARTLPANMQQEAFSPLPAGQALPPLEELPRNGVAGGGLAAPSALIASTAPGAPQPLETFDQTTVGMSMLVATIPFEIGSSSLDANDRAVLNDVVGLFRQNGRSVRVVGHASSRTRDLDPTTHQLTNLNVSVDRANRVAKELMRLGVPPEKIYVGAKSDSEPLYYEVMPSGEAGNRRTEVYIDY